MTLRQEYLDLENKIVAEYERLINIGDYDILTQAIKECYDTEAENILEFIKNEGINEAARDYDILSCFTEVYYNDRRGDERMAYLLRVEKEYGLYVFDYDYFDTMFISFSELNGLLSKINVIEEIQKS